MNPDDTNTNPLDAAYAVRATADELVRLLREATPVNWDSTPFHGEEL
jgi:hypothetical protein